MTQDFEEKLRQAIGTDEVEVPADTEQAIAAGRRIVRGRRIGWGLGACAVVAAAVLVLPGVLQRPVAAVPALPVSTATASAAPADGWLVGTEWSVVKLGGTGIVPGSSMTLEFGDGVVTGFGGCNGFGYGMSGTTVDGGWYRQSGNRLTIGQVAARTKGCSPAGITEQETTYFQTLTAVQRFTVAGDTLNLLGADDAVLVELGRVPVALEGTGWQVTGIKGAAPAAGRQPYLLFRKGVLVANNGCNFSTGDFSQTGDRLVVAERGSSLIACTEPAMQQQEPAFDDAVSRVQRVVVHSGRLHLLDHAGAVMLEAIPDAARVLDADGFTWRLDGKDGPTQITLKVGNGQLTGKTGCGDYTADFTRTGDAWTVTDVRRRNMLPCPNTTSAMSEGFLAQLQTVTKVEATATQLRLVIAGETLFFTRK